MARKRTPSQSLAEYRRKRDFTKTAEPAGASRDATSAQTLHFVIQKHAASHLHYDLRLELDGVMKSWAVPKGPSYDPSVRRLAMQVEDHPIEYNTFEGIIPQGEYGGGTVMLWDRGTYEPEAGGGEDAVREGYRKGDLKVVFHGTRLDGGWVLVRMRRDERGRAQWLLIKHRDDTADAEYDVTAEETTSVTTGRSMEQIATRSRRVWRSNRSDTVTPKKRKASKTTAKKPTAKKASAKKTAAKKASARKPAAKKAPATRARSTSARAKKSARKKAATRR